nr:RNA-directed DNA polymerase, eukaryota [Tanacetum cinerariifolium]
MVAISKEEEVQKISTSIFVTNFSDHAKAKDLWNVCKQYGQVVDAFIPDKKSKTGKRYGFVRFIRVYNVDRLVSNLLVDAFIPDRKSNAGSHHLHTNVARFQRPPAVNSGGYTHQNGNYVLKKQKPIRIMEVERSKCLFGKVKEFSNFDNMTMVLGNKGFNDIHLRYMGGFIKEDFDGSDAEKEGDNNISMVPDSVTEDANVEAEEKGNDLDVNNSLDPFELYPLLNKKRNMEEKIGKSNGTVSIPFPLGFTPCDEREVKCDKKSMGNNEGSGGVNLLIISMYAPQEYAEKKMLWDYLVYVISKWDGEVIVMGDFNEAIFRTKRLSGRCGIDKSLGPDGVTFGFIRRYWSLIEKDVVAAVQHFLLSDFLGDVLNHFGFGAKWCGWIQECLRSSHGSVLVNGSPTEEFQFYKGLKQGDPLSLFLFILVMESLHLSFKTVEDAGMFNGIKINSSMTLSHMFYADDAIFMGQWSKWNIDTLMYMLKCFERASGLSINLSKSKLMGLEVSVEKVEEVTRHIGCGILNTPFSFLGSKVGGYMSRIKSWDEVIDKMVKRLSKWKMKTLSIGGLVEKGMSVIHRFGAILLKKWIVEGEQRLKDVFPSIYTLEVNKHISVAFKFEQTALFSSLRKMPRSGVGSEQWDHLLDSLEGVMLNPSKDRWSWDLNGSGEFIVASAR